MIIYVTIDKDLKIRFEGSVWLLPFVTGRVGSILLTISIVNNQI